MINRRYTCDLFGCYCLFLFLIFFLGGCSSTGTPYDRQGWRCNSLADAAVNRQDWSEALARHKMLLNQDPDNCLAIYHLGYIYGQIGDRTEEVSLYEKAVQCGLDSDDLLFFNLGMAYGELNNIGKAMAAFEKAVALNPKNAENYFGLGVIAKADEQIEKAQVALLEAVDVDPHHWESHILLIRIYLDQGRLEEAHRHLKVLPENLQDNEEVLTLWQIYKDRSMTTFDPSSG